MTHLVHKKPSETYLSAATGFFWGEIPVPCVLIEVVGTQSHQSLECNESKALSEVLGFECKIFCPKINNGGKTWPKWAKVPQLHCGNRADPSPFGTNYFLLVLPATGGRKVASGSMHVS